MLRAGEKTDISMRAHRLPRVTMRTTSIAHLLLMFTASSASVCKRLARECSYISDIAARLQAKHAPLTLVPTTNPSLGPTPVPTLSLPPSPVPIFEPTPLPIPEPTFASTPQPSPLPSLKPTPVPTLNPTSVPSPVPTLQPTGLPTWPPTPQPSLPTLAPTPLPANRPTNLPTPQPAIPKPGHDSSNPAASGMVILDQGDASGWYWIQPSSSVAAYHMYVDNDRNEGGWVLTARATVASCQAHWSNGAVNIDSTTGPSSSATAASKVADSWMNELRSASSYSGTTAYWMESTGTWGNGYGPQSTFISTCASVDLVSSANEENCRTIVSTTYEGSMSDEEPNTGTRGFGNHHASDGTYFAYMRHPEEGTNCGFSSDILGAGGYSGQGSDGNLWIK